MPPHSSFYTLYIANFRFITYIFPCTFTKGALNITNKYYLLEKDPQWNLCVLCICHQSQKQQSMIQNLLVARLYLCFDTTLQKIFWNLSCNNHHAMVLSVNFLQYFSTMSVAYNKVLCQVFSSSLQHTLIKTNF